MYFWKVSAVSWQPRWGYRALSRTVTILGIAMGCGLAYAASLAWRDSPPEMAHFAESTQTSEEAKILSQASTSQGTQSRQIARVQTKGKSVRRAQAQAKRVAVRYVFLHDPSVSRAIRELIARDDRIFSQLQSVTAKLMPPAAGSKNSGDASTVQVDFNKQAVEEELQRLTGSNFRVVTLLPEFSDDKPLSSRRIETAVEKELAANKFEVYDWNFVAAEQPVQNLVDATLRGQHPAYGSIAARFHANWIIVGRVESNPSQNNQGIISYRAYCDAKAINVASGRTIPLDSYDSVGFGDTDAKARDQALDKLAAVIRADVPKQLTLALPIHPIKFVSSTATPRMTDLLVERLKAQPGVEDVQVQQNGAEVAISALSRDRLSAITTKIETEYPSFTFDSEAGR